MKYPNENYETPYEELQSLVACLDDREVEALVIVVRKMLDVEAEGDFDYLTPKDIKIINEAHEHINDPSYWTEWNKIEQESDFDLENKLQKKSA